MAQGTERKYSGRPVLVLLSCVLCLVSSAFFTGCATLNPATGKQEFILFNTPAEVTMGQEIDAQIRAAEKVSQDPVAVARLERIGRKVAQFADRKDYEYQFILIDKDELNAFTIPGGKIYFYTGLLNKLKSDDAIASVLAHEVGHCSSRHVIKKYQAGLGYNLVSGILLGNIESQMTAQLAKMGADALMQLGTSAYSRQDEFEADRLGLKYMHLAGFNTQGMVDAFEVLAKESKGDDSDWILLRSHPRINDRIEAVKKEIEVVKTK